MRTEQEIRAYLNELQETYSKASSPVEMGRKKPAHMVALALALRHRIDLLKWVLGEGNKV